LIVLYYIFISIENNPLLEFYINSTSYLSGLILHIFDSSINTNNQIIAGKTFNIILSFGCEGSEPLAVFAAGIFAYPSDFKSKIIGLTIGLPLLYVLNIFRIILLYVIGTTYHQLFDIFHTTLFPIIFILFALFFWIIWIQRFTSKK